MAEENGWYYRISKDDKTKRLILERGRTLTGTFECIDSETLRQLEGVEGPEIYLLPDGKTWCLIADRIDEGTGYLPVLSENLSEGIFEILPEEAWDMGESQKRHGGVLTLTDEEYDRLLEKFGTIL